MSRAAAGKGLYDVRQPGVRPADNGRGPDAEGRFRFRTCVPPLPDVDDGAGQRGAVGGPHPAAHGALLGAADQLAVARSSPPTGPSVSRRGGPEAGTPGGARTAARARRGRTASSGGSVAGVGRRGRAAGPQSSRWSAYALGRPASSRRGWAARHVGRVLVVAVALVAALAGSAAVTAAAAPAGGAAVTIAVGFPARGRDVPDVAMVVAGGTGRTVSVRSGQRDFARLWQLLQPTHTETERVPEDWAEGDFPQVRLTVLWGLSGVGGWPSTNRPPGGDVAVERQDQLLVAEDGTPWVRSDPSPTVEDDDIRWHRAPRSVFERFDLARLLGDAEGGPVASPAAAADLDGPVRGDVRWAVTAGALGLAAGAGGTLLIRRAAARREAGPPREEPRQVLIDLDE